MARRVSDWLAQASRGWAVLAALLAFALFGALVLPGQAASAERASGGAGSPDTSFTYTPRDLYAMAEAYGEAGRSAYIRARFTFDLVFPLVYTAFLVTSVSWLFARAFRPGSRWRLANLAPVLGMLFDYLENSATSLVMLRFPERTPVVDVLAPALTLIKWLFVGGSFVLLALGALVVVWRWVKARSGSSRTG